MLLSQKSQPCNLDEMAFLHQACFPGSLSSQLGKKYARRTLQWFLSDEHRFLIHVNQDEKMVGYVGGFISQYPGDGSTSGMLRFAMREAVSGVVRKPWLIFHKNLRQHYPLVIRNIYQKIIPGKKHLVPVKKYLAKEQKIGLVVIGVHPDNRGNGVFELLMKAFEEESRKRKIEKMVLSVKPDNKRAIRAYQKVAWQIDKESISSVDMYKFSN
ncbi:MAG: GNAT family N-acetyltransferase [Bacteroidetes bacterium]|nr:GNAT family N-acetyltransferase [Bacteroidota bacterium]